MWGEKHVGMRPILFHIKWLDLRRWVWDGKTGRLGLLENKLFPWNREFESHLRSHICCGMPNVAIRVTEGRSGSWLQGFSHSGVNIWYVFLISSGSVWCVPWEQFLETLSGCLKIISSGCGYSKKEGPQSPSTSEGHLLYFQYHWPSLQKVLIKSSQLQAAVNR